ncbi:MAG TPA: hypothetical protein VGI63_05865 [Verrucomicrobiae bacterium]|jgi:hypothetical protein
MQIRILPVSERTTWGELPELFETTFTFYEENGGVPPLLVFEPCEEPLVLSEIPSEAPEELLIVSLESSVKQEVYQALKRIEAREPEYPTGHSQKSLKFKDNTSLKSIFRQMAEMPVTVFSMPLLDDDPDAISIFFIRTAFTISEFRREI